MIMQHKVQESGQWNMPEGNGAASGADRKAAACVRNIESKKHQVRSPECHNALDYIYIYYRS
jgi:hypothetical protein